MKWPMWHAKNVSYGVVAELDELGPTTDVKTAANREPDHLLWNLALSDAIDFHCWSYENADKLRGLIVVGSSINSQRRSDAEAGLMDGDMKDEIWIVVWSGYDVDRASLWAR